MLDQELISCRYSSYSSVAAAVVVVVLLLLLGATSSKSLMLRRFKSDGDEPWKDCSSSDHASIDSQMAAVMSFHEGSVVSKRMGIKFGSNLLHVNTHRLTESVFRFDVIISKWRP